MSSKRRKVGTDLSDDVGTDLSDDTWKHNVSRYLPLPDLYNLSRSNKRMRAVCAKQIGVLHDFKYRTLPDLGSMSDDTWKHNVSRYLLLPDLYNVSRSNKRMRAVCAKRIGVLQHFKYRTVRAFALLFTTGLLTHKQRLKCSRTSKDIRFKHWCMRVSDTTHIATQQNYVLFCMTSGAELCPQSRLSLEMDGSRMSND
jgi:hypothetical protein